MKQPHSFSRRRILRPASAALALTLASVVTLTGASASSERQLGGETQAGEVRVTLKGKTLVAQALEESTAAKASSSGLDYYIVQLADQPAAAYRGGLQGLAATNPRVTGARRLNTAAPNVAAYRGYLAQRQNETLATIEQSVGHGLDVLHRYDVAFNGFAVKLTAQEAARVQRLDDVVRVERNELRQLTTDAGPNWIGAPDIWTGANGQPATKGEGIIVGVIDTGINSDHPSFADIGGDGYDHTNPLGAGVYKGWCNPLPPPAILMTCNDKLIGMWSFASSGNNPEDDDGHGSHTASTAAGNVVTGTLVVPTTTVNGNLSGVAPHANIIAYDACTPSGCPTAALLAAVNQAAADGVDVINYSISGGSDPYNDTVSIAFLNATAAGVFVSASAGNSGPGPSTTDHSEPWVQTVAAATHDRKFVNTLNGMAGGATAPPPDMIGESLTSGLGSSPIVYAGNFGDPMCPLGAFPPGTFTNQIVVCDRGGNIGRVDKAQSVLNGGADGFVLANDLPNGSSLVADGYPLPGVHITYADGVTLKAWLASGSGHVAAISGTTAGLNPAFGDVMASFSSRGPSTILPDVIKPDITGPGVSVWAADQNGASPPEYQLLSGTSMSSPHSAGSAALVRAQHPTWTPPMVKSALMLTARATGVLKEDGTTPAIPFDRGSGRLDLTAAGRAGFVLDETTANFNAANPATGGNPTTLNLASLADASCFQTCGWTRTVTSVVGDDRTYTGTPSASWLSITTSNPFLLATTASAGIGVSADVTTLAKNQWHFGTITWSDSIMGTPDLVMTVAVFASGSTDSLTLNKTADVQTTSVGGRINYTITVSNKNPTPATFSVTDPVPANTTYVPGSAMGGLTYNSGPNDLTGSTGVLDPVAFSLITNPSPFGYIPPASLSGGFVNRCLVTTQCDDSGTNLGGVNFIYQGVTYTNVVFGTNGVILPGGSTVPPATNQNLPNPALPNNVIAPFWADLDGNGTSVNDPGAGFYYYGSHENPDNGDVYLVLGWEGMQQYSEPPDPSRTYTFQVWIQMGTDKIWFVYQALGGLPVGPFGGLTVGLENAAGSLGFTRFYRALGSCNPTCSGDIGTPPAIGTDLKVNPLLDSATFTFAVDLSPSVPVSTLIQNIVTATDGGPTTVQAVADTLVNSGPSADLSITKTDGLATATAGQPLSYTIVVSNAGPSGVMGATVADTVPAAFTGATWSCIGAGGGTCTGAGVGDILDSAVNLPPGASVTYTLNGTVDPAATGLLSNTATVAPPVSVPDPNAGNNSATDIDTLASQADLSITKNDGLTTAIPGQPVTYTIVASNAGPSSATGATVADTVPGALTGVTWTCFGAGGGTCGSAAGTGSISDTVNLPPGGSVTYTLTGTIVASASGTLANTATVAPPIGTTDPTPGNNSATDIDTLTPEADLGITKTDGLTTVPAGQPVTYTIVVSNSGPSVALGATVADTLPAALTGATWTCSATVGSSCTAAGVGDINDTVNLLAGGQATYTLTATVDSGATGSVINTATVAPPLGVTDPNPGNNSGTDIDTIFPPPTVVTDPATTVGELSATLNGTVNPNGGATQAYFEYGTTTSYGSTTPSQGVGSGTSDVSVSQYVSGLACATTYHFRAVGVNASGTTPGGDLTFMTTACKPSRVFVSVLGLDTNDCSNIATPCRTINGAIAQVAEDGEAVVIKSGSYAGAMITKGVKVNAASGVVAFSGQPVTVNAPFAKVVIRGLTLKALTPGTGDGILIQDAGAVFLENVVADGWDNGVKQVNAGEVFVKDSVMRNNVTGYWATDGKLAMDNVRLTNNGDGIYTEAPDVSVRGSTISGSTLSGIYVEGGSVTVEKSQITNNDWSGITVCMEPSATARVSRSLVSGNGIGLENLTGSLYVYGNNAVRGNTLDTSGTITPAGLQ